MRELNVMRLFKTLHGWIGVLVLPWVILAGLSGIYMNHSKAILGMIPAHRYDERAFDRHPLAHNVDEAESLAVAQRQAPGEVFVRKNANTYHSRPVFSWKSPQTRVIVDRRTGHYWVKDGLTRRTYGPDDQMLDRKIYWGAVFSRLHKFGFIDSRFGRWITDILATVLVVFGITGLTLFLSPRLRRRKNRREQARRLAALQAKPPAGRQAAPA